MIIVPNKAKKSVLDTIGLSASNCVDDWSSPLSEQASVVGCHRSGVRTKEGTKEGAKADRQDTRQCND